MKKVMTIFGVILFASIIFTSCGGEKKSDETKVTSQELQGKYFKSLDGDAAIYFIDNNELIGSYVSMGDGDVHSFKYKYSLKDNELILHNKDKRVANDVDDKYIIYNNEVIMYFFDGEYEHPEGVFYRLSE